MASEPVSVKTAAERRALVGKRISWTTAGWTMRRCGTVRESRGRNLRVDDDWLWAPDMRDVRIEQ